MSLWKPATYTTAMMALKSQTWIRVWADVPMLLRVGFFSLRFPFGN